MTDRPVLYTPNARYVTAKEAARELGVAVELVVGLVVNRQVAGVHQIGTKGNWVTMVERTALVDLKARMG